MGAHQKALYIFEHVYGINHTDVGRALDSLGRVQREWGDLEGALSSFTRAEEISDLQFGPNYAHAGTAAVNRALLIWNCVEFFRQELWQADKGLAIYRLAYGEDLDFEAKGAIRNESTAWAVFVRASALCDLGEVEKGAAASRNCA